jgi:hypothetical protein
MTATPLGNSSHADISRFLILSVLFNSFFGLTCFEISKTLGKGRERDRHFRASIATRLRRLRASGLVRCELDKFAGPTRSRRTGIFRWRLTRHGETRLQWAKSQGLV